jgi:glutamate-ammonia-ligase adenylyltransferase
MRETIREVLTRPRDPDRLLSAVADMRRRLEKEFGTENPWNTKHVRGGLLDLEFIAQYLQLRHGSDHPGIFSPHTSTAIGKLRDAGLIQQKIADDLLDAVYLEGVVRTYLRQIFGEKFDPETQTAPGIRTGLARAAKVDDFAELESALLASQKRVKEIYDELVEEPAAALPAIPDSQEKGELK